MKSHNALTHLLRWGPVIFWCLLIFFLSAQSKLPGPEDGVADFLFKKTAHVAVYAILYFFVFRAFLGVQMKRRFLYSFLFCFAYAISDEVHQSFVPGRTATIRDVGFDVIGMIGMYGKLHGYQLLRKR